MDNHTCRFCRAPLEITFVDLGMSPLANSFLSDDDLNNAEIFYPLHVFVCEKCFLVQIMDYEKPENIFSNYVYFSSYSDSWLNHAENYVKMMISKFGYNKNSLVLEIASNDGYLLQYFKKARIPVLGIEPAANIAKIAEEKDIPTKVKFFGIITAKELISEGIVADLVIGNNVLAHVPDLNDFVDGMKVILKPDGIITMEFPHLLQLIQNNQFDTIYHEHFSYFSLHTVKDIFSTHGLVIFDVEELPTHGGSLRIYAKHKENKSLSISQNIFTLLQKEVTYGLRDINTYMEFSEKIKATKMELLDFLINIKRSGKKIVGYGAAAKGNTLLNFCGIGKDFLDYVVDRSPHKQGLYLPGTHVIINKPEKIIETKPDYLLILPWNLHEEIIQQMRDIHSWGGKFIIPIPKIKIY